MMSFCKTRVHSFLGLSFSTTDYPDPPPPPPPPPPSLPLGLITTTAATAKETHYRPSSNVLLDSTAIISKRDPGGIGFVDEVGGCVDGLTSCTESLGFESSDERQPNGGGSGGGGEEVSPRALRPERVWKAEETSQTSDRKYPPPLSSMSKDGQPSFILRPVRRDGRLELTEVRISRPEIFQASREDGRLRLRLIIREDEREEEVEEDEDLDLDTTSESEIRCYSQQEEGMMINREEESKEEIISELEEEKGNDAAWVMRRCNEEVATTAAAVGHDNGGQQVRQPHEVHVWRQHCVV